MGLVLDALRPILRAGGGHSFSGGGSGGHSGGGSSAGGIVDAIVLVIIVVVIVIAVVVAIVKAIVHFTTREVEKVVHHIHPGSQVTGAAAAGEPEHGDRPATTTPTTVRGNLVPGTATGDGAPRVGDEGSDEGLGAIVAHDPAFDREAFLEQCQRCFFIVQEAWSERKPEMSRQVMADGLWQQHRVQIQGYIDEHKRNILGDLAVGSMNFVSAHTDTSYDTVVVRVTAACSDYDIDDSDGKVVRGNKRVGQWAEDWTFQRSSKASTKEHGGTLAQKCPNCGAPLNVDLAGVCPYCKAPVMSGEYDWVLARISQLNV